MKRKSEVPANGSGIKERTIVVTGAERYFFSSSACAYNIELQKDPRSRALKEFDAYPAMAERGYGWEKLVSEMFCQEYWAERGLKTFIARFHNVYGPQGTWDGGREKAPAAIARKVIEAKYAGDDEIEVWGDGTQTRSFMFIDDCVKGIEEQYRLRQAGTKTEFPAATPDLGPLTNLEPVQARPMVMAPES